MELGPQNHIWYGFWALIPYWQSKRTLWECHCPQFLSMFCETKLFGQQIRKEGPPGPSKYVKQWPFRLIFMASGYYFTYFWGPGSSYRCSCESKPVGQGSEKKPYTAKGSVPQTLSPSSAPQTGSAKNILSMTPLLGTGVYP